MKTHPTSTARHSSPGRTALLVALAIMGTATAASARERLPRARLVAQIELPETGEGHQVAARIQHFTLAGSMLVEGARGAEVAGQLTTLLAGTGYLHTGPRGVFIDATIGGALTLSGEEIDGTCPHCDDGRSVVRDPKEDNLDRALGAAVLASVGFTHRVSRTLGLAYELFGGFYHGLDDKGRELNSVTVGVALSLDI